MKISTKYKPYPKFPISKRQEEAQLSSQSSSKTLMAQSQRLTQLICSVANHLNPRNNRQYSKQRCWLTKQSSTKTQLMLRATCMPSSSKTCTWSKWPLTCLLNSRTPRTKASSRCLVVRVVRHKILRTGPYNSHRFKNLRWYQASKLETTALHVTQSHSFKKRSHP